MPLIPKRPLTPSQRFAANNRRHVDKKKPEKSLTIAKRRTGGRNCYGRVTSRRRGGGHLRRIRIIDFARDKFDVVGNVLAIEYDPNRTANIALVEYPDGEKRYIIAPKDMRAGATVMSSEKKIAFQPGNNMPLSEMPPASYVHNIELIPGQGGKIARGAGQSAQLMGIEGKFATLKMPSGEIRMVHNRCRATMGVVGNAEHQKRSLGKAGRSRWLGRRPRVRGVAMNPVDHPMGGGEGRTSGGGHPVSPWGKLSKGQPTRRRSKTTNKLILVRRDGRRLKR